MIDVLSILPHRPPMLHIDRILELREDYCKAVKNISNSEPCFMGHFPENPIFPGVLTVETLGQTCSCVLCNNNLEKLPVFVEIHEAKFLKPVYPGAILTLEGKIEQESKGFFTFSAVASVEQTKVCTTKMVIVQR